MMMCGWSSRVMKIMYRWSFKQDVAFGMQCLSIFMPQCLLGYLVSNISALVFQEIDLRWLHQYLGRQFSLYSIAVASFYSLLCMLRSCWFSTKKLKPLIFSGLAELVYPHALTAQVKFECLWTMVFALFQFGMLFPPLFPHWSDTTSLRRYHFRLDDQRRAHVYIYLYVGTCLQFINLLTRTYYS